MDSERLLLRCKIIVLNTLALMPAKTSKKLLTPNKR